MIRLITHACYGDIERMSEGRKSRNYVPFFLLLRRGNHYAVPFLRILRRFSEREKRGGTEIPPLPSFSNILRKIRKNDY